MPWDESRRSNTTSWFIRQRKRRGRPKDSGIVINTDVRGDYLTGRWGNLILSQSPAYGSIRWTMAEIGEAVGNSSWLLAGLRSRLHC